MRGKKKTPPINYVPIYLALERAGYGDTSICKALKTQHRLIEHLKKTGWKE